MLVSKSFIREAKKNEVVFHNDFFVEIESFITRNQILATTKNRGIYKTCPQCLKAHMVETVRKLGMSEICLDYIIRRLKGPIGHKGFYLDGFKVVKI
jgi:hypothetical protein